MDGLILYTDKSSASVGVEQALSDRGVKYTRVENGPGERVLPVLVGPTGTFEGATNIRLYFLNRLAKGVGRSNVAPSV